MQFRLDLCHELAINSFYRIIHWHYLACLVLCLVLELCNESHIFKKKKKKCPWASSPYPESVVYLLNMISLFWDVSGTPPSRLLSFWKQIIAPPFLVARCGFQLLPITFSDFTDPAAFADFAIPLPTHLHCVCPAWKKDLKPPTPVRFQRWFNGYRKMLLSAGKLEGFFFFILKSQFMNIFMLWWLLWPCATLKLWEVG